MLKHDHDRLQSTFVSQKIFGQGRGHGGICTNCLSSSLITMQYLGTVGNVDVCLVQFSSTY